MSSSKPNQCASCSSNNERIKRIESQVYGIAGTLKYFEKKFECIIDKLENFKPHTEEDERVGSPKAEEVDQEIIATLERYRKEISQLKSNGNELESTTVSMSHSDAAAANVNTDNTRISDSRECIFSLSISSTEEQSGIVLPDGEPAKTCPNINYDASVEQDAYTNKLLEKFMNKKVRAECRLYLAYFHDKGHEQCIDGTTKFSLASNIKSAGLPTDYDSLLQLYINFHTDDGEWDEKIVKHDLQVYRVEFSEKYNGIKNPPTLEKDNGAKVDESTDLLDKFFSNFCASQ